MSEADQEKLHFLDYWRVIRSRWEIVVAIMLLVLMTGAAITLTLPKEFMASARIQIEQEQRDFSPFERRTMLWDYNPFFLRTEYEVIQSKAVLYEVIKRANLQEKWGKYYNDGEPLDLQEAYMRLRDLMRVHQYRDTNLVEIQIYLNTPIDSEPWREAADLANQVVKAYRDNRLNTQYEKLRRGIEALEAEFQKQQEKVAVAEAKLEDIRKKGGISTIASGIQLDKAGLTHLEANRIAARVDMLVRKARLEQVQNLEGDKLMNSVRYIVDDAGLEVLRRQLVDSEVQLSLLEQSYGENHPDVVKTKAGIRKIKVELEDALTGLKAGLRADYEVALAKFEAVEAELNAAKTSDIDAESEHYLPFVKAERDMELQRQILAALETRLSQEGIERELPRTPVEVVDWAEPDDKAVGPNVVLNILLSLILGLGGGVGLAYLIEYLDTSVKTVDDIERLLGMPVLGVIPQKVLPLVEEGGDSPHAEAYRVLRTNMHFSSKTTGAKTFCVTSGGPGEGKSLTLFNLAYVSALLGDKMLVVDSDFRRPTQHRMFGVSNEKGLVNVLLGDAKIEDVIRGTKMPNLHFMPSGRIRSTGLSLLDSHKMLDLVKNLKLRYDYVFFDTPPIVGVSDASVLASEVDGVLLVIQHRKYPRQISTRAKNLIENVGGNLIGVVLNNINIARDYYSYYYHSSYHYHKGYGQRDGADEEDIVEAGVADEK
ncbi:MAG: polysaccharide biosynthesis tyrosine autokinase [Kiritimatiellae bacterium]|nr:polysaccharide biosynthesis tyrosine autokinase [Kiritimatiellia bacterium]